MSRLIQGWICACVILSTRLGITSNKLLTYRLIINQTTIKKMSHFSKISSFVPKKKKIKSKDQDINSSCGAFLYWPLHYIMV